MQRYNTQGISEDLIETEHKDLIQHIVCRICYMLIQQPILSCDTCEYYACGDCIQNWKQSSQNLCCPQKCSTTAKFVNKPNKQVEIILKMIKIRCPNSVSANGNQVSESKIKDLCPEKLKYSELQSHIIACQYRKVKCRNHLCPQVVLQKDMAEHASACEFSMIPCKYCHQTFKEHVIKQHLKSCDLKPVSCMEIQCHQQMRQKDLISHMQNECLYRTIQCDTCKEKVIFIEKERHLKEQCAEASKPCEFCATPIKGKDYPSHYRTCGQRTVQCNSCNQTFMNSDVHNEDSCIMELQRRISIAFAKKEACSAEIQRLVSQLNYS